MASCNDVGVCSLVSDSNAFWLGETDLWLLAEGRHLRPWEKLGAHPCTHCGVKGTAFAVWAPNARRVSVVGDFNHWDTNRHPMYLHRNAGVWELFVPHVDVGALYKFAVQGAGQEHFSYKVDPYALHTENGACHASIVMGLPQPVDAGNRQGQSLHAPMSVYEVHAGSWQRPNGQLPTWDYLSQHLIPYVADLGFTHLELMPVNEHPFYGSWGYQPTGLYAPTARYGSPASFREFVACAHRAGLKVILDWVPAHFPSDAHALAQFDGTPLYEHSDPREGFHRDWNTLIYNYGRTEVRNFLVGNALFWIERYGIDGLRVDAVASMLYRDYSRAEGEWVPNRDGGRENYEAMALLREVNEVLGTQVPGAITVAEESTAFPGVTAPPWNGGLGFHYKWNLGWMHDTLAYLALDPVYRSHHHDRISFAMVYAYSEHYVLALSHDEVVHGKGSLYNKMSGDPWQKRANLRILFALMYAHPGRKLLFMGCEFGQTLEWNHDTELQWGLLADPAHAGLQQLVRDLNKLYRGYGALHTRDDAPGGFAWINVHDRSQSVFSFVRHGQENDPPVVVVVNMTPVVRHGYRLGMPQGGLWREILNTDSTHYAGSGIGNCGQVRAETDPAHGMDHCAVLNLPPLGVLWLTPERRS